MSFVAQKLGFIKCSSQSKFDEEIGKRKCSLATGLADETSLNKKRKLSNEEESSDSGSLSLGKLRITDSSESDLNDVKQVNIPQAMRPNLQTKSVLTYLDFSNYPPPIGMKFPFSMSEGMGPIPFKMEFPASQYLSSLVAPYGTPLKFIGPITTDQRKEKVERYLQKKKSRHWKNVKYTVRQELAETRKREHGRFVKSDKKWRWNETPVITPEPPKLSSTPIDDSLPTGLQETLPK